MQGIKEYSLFSLLILLYSAKKMVRFTINNLLSMCPRKQTRKKQNRTEKEKGNLFLIDIGCLFSICSLSMLTYSYCLFSRRSILLMK